MIANLIVELVLRLGGVFTSREAAKDESTNDARRVTSVLARAVVTPNLSDALLLQLVQLPLAWSMARRLDGSLRERDRLAWR